MELNRAQLKGKDKVMLKNKRCLIPRIAKNPKAFYRWIKLYMIRVKQTEKELGSEIRPC